MIEEQTLRLWANELGFAEAALCSAAGFERAYRIVGEQEPLAERKQLRFYPEADYPCIKSLAVLLWVYMPAALPQGEEVFVDSYYLASNAAYHAARELETRLLSAGCFAKANVSYPAKEAAVRADLGVIGRNSLLITPEHGTRVVIILMATDMELSENGSDSGEKKLSSCRSCGRCAAACPARAIDEHGMTHPERCLRNFMMEGVVVPEHLRSKIGMRMIGCDICQRVCPMQPSAELAQMDMLHLEDFMTTDQAAFSKAVSRLAQRIGRNAARPQRVRAQAALLAGNSGNAAYLPVLHEWAQSPFEVVREHACWAIRRLELMNGRT